MVISQDVEGQESDLFRRYSNFRRRGHRRGAMRGWDAREYIGWDGEGVAINEPTRYVTPQTGEALWFDDQGNRVPKPDKQPQPYVLLAHSKGQHIKRQEGVTTRECFA